MYSDFLLCKFWVYGVVGSESNLFMSDLPTTKWKISDMFIWGAAPVGVKNRWYGGTMQKVNMQYAQTLYNNMVHYLYNFIIGINNAQ